MPGTRGPKSVCSDTSAYARSSSKTGGGAGQIVRESTRTGRLGQVEGDAFRLGQRLGQQSPTVCPGGDPYAQRRGAREHVGDGERDIGRAVLPKRPGPGLHLERVQRQEASPIVGHELDRPDEEVHLVVVVGVVEADARPARLEAVDAVRHALAEAGAHVLGDAEQMVTVGPCTRAAGPALDAEQVAQQHRHEPRVQEAFLGVADVER